MQSIGSSNSEFRFYEYMVYSRLERYPTEYSSTDYLDWLAKLQDEELKDEVEEEGSDNEDYGLITGTEKQNLKLYQSSSLY